MLFKICRIRTVFLALLVGPLTAKSQQIVDACFSSLPSIGKYYESADIRNICGCGENYEASDLIEWDGTKWLGALTPLIKRPPPDGCNNKAMWMGYDMWTYGGEGFAMRLDKPLEGGKTYSFTFTYARDGNGELDELDADEFSPHIYTDVLYPQLSRAYRVGRLPPTVDWKTSTFTFTAHEIQAGHDWIIIHTRDCSGTVLSNCYVDTPIENIVLPRDTTLCLGDTAILYAPTKEQYRYRWNTGDTTASIAVMQPGSYSVDIFNEKCFSSDSVVLEFENCQVEFEMPNIFTPNNDPYNETFVPKQVNYIALGTMTIYNRWGDKLFSGDLFIGWDGRYKGESVPSGIYFYDVYFRDKYGARHSVRGSVSVVK
jgi:gliding motility-associated-like protein